MNTVTLIQTRLAAVRPVGAFRALALVCGLALISPGLCAQTTVTITNPGFEDGGPFTTSNPTGWGTAGASGATFKWVTGTAGDEVHSGAHAWQILSPGVGTTQTRIQQANAARFAVTVGETYTVSLWAKGTDLDLANDQLSVSIEWWNAAGTAVVSTSGGSLLSLSSNDTWQQESVALTAIAPPGAATAKILIFFQRSANSSSTAPAVTLDDIVVTTPSSIPEPSTVALLMGTAVLAAGLGMRRRTR